MKDYKFKGDSEIFRTYLKGDSSSDDGKKCADRHKGIEQVRTFQEAEKFDCFGGVLNKGYIDISFDSKEQSDAFLEMAERNGWRCLALSNPKNGHLHTYWKDSEERIKVKSCKDKKLAVGFVADIHGGETYIPLKVFGVQREVEFQKFEDEQYQEVPNELLPVNTDVVLWDSKEGDGRNDDLFRYILILQSQLKLTQKEIIEVLTNTNNYVFSEPLPEEELEIILRDEAFKKPVFFNGSQFLFNDFAYYMKNVLHIAIINGNLHIYRDGIYKNGYREIEAAMIREISNLSDAKRKETLKYLNLICDVLEPANERYIAFRNGVFDIATGQMQDFTPDTVVTNRIPWDYNPNAFNELADQTLNKLACGDAAIRALLEECIGYCFYRSTKYQKAFMLTGGGKNGKSTFLNILKTILGKDNFSALDLKELGDRFSTEMLFGKLANVGDDIGDDFLQGSQVAIFKKIVTGNTIKAERKGMDAFSFNPYVKLLFSANDIPRMKDKTGAVLRRLVIIPFNAIFDKKDPDFDADIEYKLTEQSAIEYFIALGVRGLQRVHESQGFTDSKKVQEALDEYSTENNSIAGFMSEHGDEDFTNELTADVYKMYTVFCAANGYSSPYAIGGFTKAMKEFGYTVSFIHPAIGGKRTTKKIYVKS